MKCQYLWRNKKKRNYEIFRCETSFYNKFVKILHEILDNL